MAVITNYTTLVFAVQEVAEDDSSEFLAYIPTAIDLTEKRMFKDLDLPELEEAATGNLVSGVNTLTKPTNTEHVQTFTITTNSKKIQLRKKTESFLDDYWPISSNTSVPKYYADKDKTTFLIAPTPDSNYSYNVRYSKQPTGISSSNLTNYFTDNCSDLLFYGTMVEMSKFMKDWEQVNFWSNEYSLRQDTWNVQMMRYRRDGEFVPNSPEGVGYNSLKHTIQTNS